MDPATRALTFSSTMGPLHGLQRGETPADFEQYLDLVHPADRETFADAVEAALADGTPFEIELRAVWPTGAAHWLVVEGTLLDLGPDAAPALVGVARDIDRTHAVIDELVEAHRSGDEARALIDAVYASAPVGLAFLDGDLRYVRVNDALAEINGLPAAEHAGRTPAEILGTGGEAVEALMRRVLGSGEPVIDVEVELERPGRPGEQRSYTASYVPITKPGGRIVGLGAAVRDITDRVAADREREQVLEQARFLAEASAALDASLDLDETLTAVADLAVRRIADWASIDLATAAGPLQNAAVAHVDPEKVAFARELQQRYSPDPDAPRGAANVIRTGRPELYSEIAQELLEAGAVNEEHLAVIRSLDLGSAMVLPLRARSMTLGALTLVRTRDREPYTEADLPFALEIAGRAALAVDNARLYGEMREQRDLYDTMLRAQSDLGEASLLIEGERIVYVNEAAERISGRSADELRALGSFIDLLPEDRHRRARDRLARVAASETMEPGFETELVRPDGTTIPLEVAAKPLGGGSNRVIVIARDIGERKQQEAERQTLLAVEQAARRAAQAAHERQRMLADVSALLERSLNLEETLQAVAELAVARLADMCVIDVRGVNGAIRRLGADSRAPNGRQMLLLLAAQSGLASRPDHPVAQIMREGQPRFFDDPVALIEASLRAATGSPKALRGAIGRSTVALPLTARGRQVGLMSLGWAKEGRRPDREEWTLLEALGQRVALAVDGALQFEERAHVARTLQASLLPPSLPGLPGAEAAGHYAAAGEGVEVGGDFYDLFALGEGRWALVIGDVCGKGAEAAAVTALARYTLRAVAGPASQPDELLETLNRTLRRQYREPRFLTAVVAVLELGTSGAPGSVTAAAAGHPPPLVLRARGGGEALATQGRLVGVTDRIEATVARATLEPGDTLVLYTDGVTEARRPAPLTPEELLATLLPHGGRGVGAITGAMAQIARAAAPGPLRDDVAILAVRIATPTLLLDPDG